MEKTILIVDDDEMSLHMAEFMLRKKTYQTISANSGEECLAALRKGKPDLILLDIEMPGMNGIETAERLRAAEETEKLPVIFLSGDKNPETEAAAWKAGAAGFIRKPFRPQELWAAVELLLSRF